MPLIDTDSSFVKEVRRLCDRTFCNELWDFVEVCLNLRNSSLGMQAKRRTWLTAEQEFKIIW